MFTVLTNTRSSSVYLIGALAATMVIILTLAVVPTISAPERVMIPAGSSASEANSDYFQRHPESNASVATGTDTAGDFYLRHPVWAINPQVAAVPVTGISPASDYFQRHPELSPPAVTLVETADYFLRHPELRPTGQQTDLSDYFLRH
jgi:hypothetical protein